MEENKNSEKKFIQVALAGKPNCGKSTLFNILTGLNQSTGNFAGVTVDKKTGTTKSNGKTIEFIDLPGTYSLKAKSLDEKITADVLTENKNTNSPDVILCIADATDLKRCLFLATQIIELNKPTVLALNMYDSIERAGIKIDVSLLSEKLGIPVIPVSAKYGDGLEDLKKTLTQEIKIPNRKFILGNKTSEESETIERYNTVTAIIRACVKTISEAKSQEFTSKIDKVITHKIWGYVIFLFILLLIFQSIFMLAAYPMNWIESLFIKLSNWGNATFPKGELSSLFINGILSGLSGVVVFIPQIAFLFFFIALLEDSGYMARASFIMDKLMRKFGLNGKSVIPLLSGVACAVPAIMGTRTISNWKERLVTIMVIPLMSCSARLPVYTLLISLVIPSKMVLGVFNLQGLVMMLLYTIGFLSALTAAWLFTKFIKSKEKSYFIMELPVYRLPRMKSILLTIIEKVKIFLVDAGKVIVAISIILWVLSSHAPNNAFQKIEEKYATSTIENKNAIIASEKLESSYAGIIGKSIEPVIAPLGFNWKIGISLITSFAAREVFVGTMATIYSVGNEDDTQSIRQKMMNEKNPATGEKMYSIAVGISLMLFYAFALQCMSTIAIVKRETNSWKWPIIQFIYLGCLAYLASFVAFHIFS